MDYYFATLTGVLDADAQNACAEGNVYPTPRRYVPKSARPHMAWSTTNVTSCNTLTRHGRIGTAHRLQGNDATTSDVTEVQDGTATDNYGLHQLLTVDATTGLSATLYRPAIQNDDTESVAQGKALVRCDVSPAIPSQRRIMHYICAEPTKTEPDVLRFLVSDDMGNIFTLRWATSPSGEEQGDVEPPHKLRRRETISDEHVAKDADSLQATWSPVLNARATSHTSTLDESGMALFTRRGALGTAGWSALAFPHASYTSAAQLVCAREHFFDVRVIDLEHNGLQGSDEGRVVHCYSTTHSPTGLHAPPGLPHCVLLTEGCLATLYDIRCPDHVLSLTDVWASVAEMRAAATKSEAEAEEETETEGNVNCAKSKQTQKVAAHEPLVPGRLTSVSGLIRDVCATANPYEVAMGVDRALHVYDYRKFTRLFTSANVLKYEIASVASMANGRAVVCAGIDSEVRIMPLYPKATLDSDKVVLSLAANKQQQAKKTAAQQNTKGDGEPAVSTFRTRLNCTVSCETTWNGAWVTAVNEDGPIAVGLSSSHELFVAQ